MNRREFVRTTTLSPVLVLLASQSGCAANAAVYRRPVRLPRYLISGAELAPVDIVRIDDVGTGIEIQFRDGERLAFAANTRPRDLLEANGGLTSRPYMALKRTIAETLSVFLAPGSARSIQTSVAGDRLQQQAVLDYVSLRQLSDLVARLPGEGAVSIAWTQAGGFGSIELRE